MSNAATIPSNDQKGRFGVAYVQSLLSHAGVAKSETSPGEDHNAVDMNINFVNGTVTAQIKCGTKAPNKDGSITVPVDQVWVAKWAQSLLPIYLVYVHLPHGLRVVSIEHIDNATILHAYALWRRVDGSNMGTGSSVNLPSRHRLTAATFDLWVDDLKAAFE